MYTIQGSLASPTQAIEPILKYTVAKATNLPSVDGNGEQKILQWKFSVFNTEGRDFPKDFCLLSRWSNTHINAVDLRSRRTQRSSETDSKVRCPAQHYLAGLAPIQDIRIQDHLNKYPGPAVETQSEAHPVRDEYKPQIGLPF
jgi:hypothetical protein